MVKLNFGTSGYDVTDKDRIIDVSVNGKFPNLDISDNYFNLEEVSPKFDYSVPGYDSISFPVKQKGPSLVSKVIMFWFDEREKWLGITYGEWLEGWRGMDSHYWGPYELDDYCKKQILRAYGLSEKDLGNCEVSGVEPSYLRDLKDKKERKR